ncbi:MAG: NifU family protein [Armatimonadetes bacterium]|nr:NifU family protein [Armatimonadota bacterium]
MRDRVQAVLEQVRPNLQSDGGDVELVDIVDGVAKVRLQGACHGCPMASMTLQMGIERVIKSQIPEITAVEKVED